MTIVFTNQQFKRRKKCLYKKKSKERDVNSFQWISFEANSVAMSFFRCALHVTLKKRGMETSGQRGSFLNISNKFILNFIHHKTSRNRGLVTIQVSFTAEYYIILYLSSKCFSRQNTIYLWQVTHDIWNVLFVCINATINTRRETKCTVYLDILILPS